MQRIENLALSSGVPHINLDILRHFEVTIPPLSTQRKIAAVLSAYDDMIENNTRRIAILEEMARNLYREWFVEYRFPGHEEVRLVDSAVGPVPDGWEVEQLGDVVELAYGKGLRKADRRPGPFPVYGSSGVIDHHDMAIVEGPGIIVGRKGNVGSVFWSDDDFCPIDTVFYVKSRLSLRYLFCNLQHQNFISADAAVPGLKRDQAYSLPLVVPATGVLNQFEDLLSLLFSWERNLSAASATLRRTRDLLLPRLVSGEVDVSELPIDTGAFNES